MKAIIFDIGRVLIHYEHAATLAGLTQVSRASTADISAQMLLIGHALGTGEMDAETFHQHMVQECGATNDFDEFLTSFAAGMARNDEALAYAVELQQRDGVSVGALSNTNQAHVAWLDTYTPELDQLDMVMMSNEVHLLKPDPDIYRLVLQMMDTPPEQAIFIDDSHENVAAAEALGITGITHTDWAITRPQLEEWLQQ